MRVRVRLPDARALSTDQVIFESLVVTSFITLEELGEVTASFGGTRASMTETVLVNR